MKQKYRGTLSDGVSLHLCTEIFRARLWIITNF